MRIYWINLLPEELLTKTLLMIYLREWIPVVKTGSFTVFVLTARFLKARSLSRWALPSTGNMIRPIKKAKPGFGFAIYYDVYEFISFLHRQMNNTRLK